MDILTQYNVEFFKQEIHGEYYFGMTSVSILLSAFVSDFDTVADANILVSAIEAVVNGLVANNIYSTESMATIQINGTVAKFYEDSNFNSTTPFFSMPTAHFKEIAEAWRDFIHSVNK